MSFIAKNQMPEEARLKKAFDKVFIESCKTVHDHLDFGLYDDHRPIQAVTDEDGDNYIGEVDASN